MRKTLGIVTVLLAVGLGATSAFADACSSFHTAGQTEGLLGALAKNGISRDLDCADRPFAARAYDRSFRAPVGRRQAWNRGRNRGYVITQREYYRGPRLCRDFIQVVYRRGREFDRAGTACRASNGTWEFL